MVNSAMMALEKIGKAFEGEAERDKLYKHTAP